MAINIDDYTEVLVYSQDGDVEIARLLVTPGDVPRVLLWRKRAFVLNIDGFYCEASMECAGTRAEMEFRVHEQTANHERSRAFTEALRLRAMNSSDSSCV